MDNILLREEYNEVNTADGSTTIINIGNSGVYETAYNKTGDLYKALLKEHGKCKSKIYIDSPDGAPQHIGWIFQKRNQYEDSPDTYLQEVWCTLHQKEPRQTVKYFYKTMGTKDN